MVAIVLLSVGWGWGYPDAFIIWISLRSIEEGLTSYAGKEPYDKGDNFYHSLYLPPSPTW